MEPVLEASSIQTQDRGRSYRLAIGLDKVPLGAKGAALLSDQWILTLLVAGLFAAGKSWWFVGAWWLILIPLWIMPWRDVLDNGRRQRRFVILSATALFGWLFYSLQSAGLAALDTWNVLSDSRFGRLLSFPLQTTIASGLTASLLAVPLCRVAGQRAVAISLIAGLPYAALGGFDEIFVISRWVDHPLSNALLLFDIVMPPLFLAEVCSLIERRSRGAQTPTNAAWRLAAQVRRLMAGDMNAGIAFFVMFCGSMALLVLGTILRRAYSDVLLASLAGSVAFALAFAAPFALSFAASIGVARALSRFKKRSLLAANIGALGQLFVGAIAVPILFWGIADEANESAIAIRNGIRSLPGPLWDVSVDGTRLYITGEFAMGVGEAAERAIENHNELETVVLNSFGGSITQALRVEAAVKKRRLSTTVDQHCESACTFVFVAGSERTLLPGMKLGFHACHSEHWFEACDADKYAADLEANGIDAAFAKKALAISPDGMWYPTVAELTAAHVITRTSEPKESSSLLKLEAAGMPKALR